MSRQICALCSMMQNEDMSNHFRRIDDSDSILFFLFLSLFMQKPYPTKLGKYFWGAAYPVVRTARPSLSCKTTHTQAMLERHFSRSLLRSFSLTSLLSSTLLISSFVLVSPTSLDPLTTPSA